MASPEAAASVHGFVPARAVFEFEQQLFQFPQSVFTFLRICLLGSISSVLIPLPKFS